MGRAFLPLLLVVAAGCLADPGPAGDDGGIVDGAPVAETFSWDANCSDPDGDGYLAEGCEVDGAVDCAEGDPAVHPGAYDVPGDALDQDCTGGPLDPSDAIAGNAVSETVTELAVDNGLLSLAWRASVNWMIAELANEQGSGANLLYTGVMPERLAGVHAWQSWFSWDPAETTTHMDVITLGPAVVRVHVDWIAGDGSGTGVGTGQVSGSIYYTVLPDGRVHRDEDVTVADTEQSWLTAYVALDRSSFTQATWQGNATPEALTGSMRTGFYDPVGTPAEWMCVYDDGDDAVGFAWQGASGNGPRLSEGAGGAGQVALQYDWVQGTGVAADTYSGQFLVVVRRDAVNPCGAVDALSNAWQRPPLLDPLASRHTAGVGDNDQDGFDEGGGYYYATAGQQRRLELTINATGGRATPTTLALRVREMDFTLDPIVSVNGDRLGHGDDYVFQVAPPDDHGWFYLERPAGFADGDVIVVEIP